jgi:uncharacterized protein YfkK (UPF0435 family)
MLRVIMSSTHHLISTPSKNAEDHSQMTEIKSQLKFIIRSILQNITLHKRTKEDLRGYQTYFKQENVDMMDI